LNYLKFSDLSKEFNILCKDADVTK